MAKAMIIQGRLIGPVQLKQVRQLLATHPDWHRTEVSRALCKAWRWRTPLGQLKDMAARSLLLKLEARGLVRLPARRSIPVNRMRQKKVPVLTHQTEALVSTLAQLRPLQVRELSLWPADLPVLESLIHQYHYLSYTGTVGLNLKYLVSDRQGRLLACALFGSSAWKCAARDEFLGWDAPTRQRGVNRITNNTRFLILPWVRVPQLGSHVLSHITGQIRQDWRRKYGLPLCAVETFVDASRFGGICYQAANWIYLGQTTGRTRQDRTNRIQVPPKAVYLYPLQATFREELTQR
jgi:hypothetical protein